MDKNKKGFTLGEVLICIMVVGIIMALSVQTIKIVKTSYASLGYFAHKNVTAMARELFSGQMPGENTSDVLLCRLTNGESTYVLKPDLLPETNALLNCRDLSTETGTNTVCNSLAEMSNTSGKILCGSENLFTAAINDDTDEPYISDLNADNPNFITTNGQRYYITKRSFDTKISDNFGFRIIAVDLNGKSKPNSVETDSKKMPPDIIMFVLLDNGDIFPIGVAADNFNISDGRIVQYINSKVKGYYYSYDTNRTEGIPSSCFVKTTSGTKQICNFAVVYAQNDEGTSFFTYREAYCNALGTNKEPAYKNYCYGKTRNILCPPSSNEKRFDLCNVENVKPLFRYNF